MNVLSSLVQVGTKGEVDWKAFKITESNILALIHIVAVIPFLISVGLYYPALLPAPIIVLIGVGLHFALLTFGSKNASRVFASTNGSLAVAWLHAGLLQPGEDLLLPLFSLQTAVVLLPWVMFDQRELKYLLGTTAFNLVLFAFIILSDGFNTWGYDNALFKDGVMYLITLFTAVIFLTGCLVLIRRGSRHMASLQRTIIEEMEQKQGELEINSKELNQYVQEVQKAREEDEKRQWVAQGSGEIDKILRSNLDMEALQDELIKNIVRYTKSNQGGLFILEDKVEEDKHLSLAACYAFDRKKFLDKRIEIGQGLVGQCYLEAEITYLKEIPENYVSITSGLGQANPRNLVLVPLLYNEKVQGVLELAAFHSYEPHEMNYLKEVASSLASYVINLKTNQRTQKLLREFQEQTETMRAQEEEMRQNLEELTATQEQMNRLKEEEEKKYKDLLAEHLKLKESMHMEE